MATFEIKPDCVEGLIRIDERAKVIERLLSNGIFVTIEEVRVILDIENKEAKDETL